MALNGMHTNVSHSFSSLLSLQYVHSYDVLWAKIVPDAFTSVLSIIPSFGTLLFSLGAVPKLPIFR